MRGHIAASIAAMCMCMCIAATSRAQSLDRSPELSIFFTADVGTLRLLGDVKPQTSWSIGGYLRQGLAWGPLIGWLRIGSDAWLTTQSSPPLQHGMRSFTTSASIGAQHAFGPWHLAAVGTWALLNLSGNPLYDTLGSHTRFHGVGGGLSIGWSGLSPLYAEVRTEALHWFGTARPTQSIEVFFSIGIRTRIR